MSYNKNTVRYDKECHHLVVSTFVIIIYSSHFYYSYTASGQLKNLMKDISSYKSCFTVAAHDEGCFKINELSFGIDLTSYVKRSQCW